MSQWPPNIPNLLEEKEKNWKLLCRPMQSRDRPVFSVYTISTGTICDCIYNILFTLFLFTMPHSQIIKLNNKLHWESWFWSSQSQEMLSVSPCCGICSVTKQPPFCLNVFREMRDKELVRWRQRWVQPSFSHTHPRTIWNEAGHWGNHFLCLCAYLMQWCMWCCCLLRHTEAKICIQ